MSAVTGHKSVQDSQVFSFGDSTIEITEFGLQKRFTLNDNLLTASEKEVYAILEERGSRSSKEVLAARPDLDKYHHVELPQDMQGGFPLNDRIVCRLNPNYTNQSLYLSRDNLSIGENGEAVILSGTVMSIPYGCLTNLDFEGEVTFFKDLPFVAHDDIKVGLLES